MNDSMGALDATPLDEIAVPVSDDESVSFARVGIGRPLVILLRSVYLGPGAQGRDLLMTSSVKNPLLAPKGVRAMNLVDTDIRDRALLNVGVGLGSQVAYYSPSLSERALSVSIELHFDAFDEGKVREWIDVGAEVAALPAFVAGGPAGQAVVKAAATAAHLVARVVDSFIDAGKPTKLEWNLHIDDPGNPRTKAGWFLLHPDHLQRPSESSSFWSRLVAEPVSEDEALVIEGEEFHIVEGELRHKDQPGSAYRGDFPYVLATLDGHKYPELGKWKPAAVAASLASRFLDQDEGELQDDVTEAFASYSDLLTLRQVAELQADLKEPELTASKKSQLEDRLDALLENVQDKELRSLAKK